MNMEPGNRVTDGGSAGEAQAAVRLYTRADEAVDHIPADAWAISARLITTLDAERMVELFTRELRAAFRYDSFEYRHDEMGIVYSDGMAGPHQLAYRLVLGGRFLGEMVLSRGERFVEAEIAVIENLICGLVYALRNAQLYREAVESAFLHPLGGGFEADGQGVRPAA